MKSYNHLHKRLQLRILVTHDFEKVVIISLPSLIPPTTYSQKEHTQTADMLHERSIVISLSDTIHSPVMSLLFPFVNSVGIHVQHTEINSLMWYQQQSVTRRRLSHTHSKNLKSDWGVKYK